MRLMKRIFYPLIIVFSFQFGFAQTWTGNTSTDWNTPSNWNGNAVPLPAANVTIPTAPVGNRWPKLAASTTLASLTMQASAQFDVNGFSLTANYLDINGTLSNSSGSTD